MDPYWFPLFYGNQSQFLENESESQKGNFSELKYKNIFWEGMASDLCLGI